MEEDNRNAYSEVIEILKLIDDEKRLEALPIEMLEVLKAKSNPEYKPQITLEIPLEEQNLQDETYQILSWIATKYWNEEVEEENVQTIQEEYQDKITQNIQGNIQENIQDSTKENIQDNYEKIETEVKEEINTNTQNISDSGLPILYKDLSWYQRIKIKIIEILNKIFKRNKKSGNEEKGLV